MSKKPNEYGAFVKLTDALLSVPHADVQRQIELHRKDAASNPKRRGPKRKAAK